jgi:hypothetical protein
MTTSAGNVAFLSLLAERQAERIGRRVGECQSRGTAAWAARSDA